MTGGLKRGREDVFGDVSFMDITPDDAYMTSETDMSDNSSSYSFMPMGEDDSARVESPKTVLDAPRMFSSGRNSPMLTKPDKTPHDHDDDNAEKRVTIWNWREKRKLSGNSAPFKKNLHEYLRKHPDWEEYRGQDKDMNGKKLTPKKRREQNNNANNSNNNSTPATPAKTISDQSSAQIPSVEVPEPVSLYMPTDEEIANRRAAEMASRRRLIEEAEARIRKAEQEAEIKRIAEERERIRQRDAQRAAAWKAAQAEAHRIQFEREVSRRQAEESDRLKRQLEDEKTQQAAIIAAVSRFSSWKKVKVVSASC
eukprot:TRINITY_DN3250_c0_g1_i1.p1 TRINITY_DN3250_c0_g1~~TRINITY_DN3250_c0_g1_i1.p1  ORF type:complete len:311 (-),score=75.98 TRINITY_DN3250_c0_g1_i1:242-1174(-)